MKFVNRTGAAHQLQGIMAQPGSSLVVVWGRRRVGKSRLLVEWCKKYSGLYFMADESSADLLRQSLCRTLAERLTGFAHVRFDDWASLFTHLAQCAAAAKWRGPLVIDELPYLALASPEIGSVLQRFVDQQARSAGLVLAVAGSSQQMMQGLVLQATAPLFGRARALLHLRPISAGYIGEALHLKSPREQIEVYALLGGMPHYWDLFGQPRGDAAAVIEQLVLNPDGVLHNEPDRLLRDEIPSAINLRPILDAIGQGAHRVSEIAARAGLSATSLARPLMRLQELDLVFRETPFGTDAKNGKKALYKISDPFFSWWFRVVAPNRSSFATMPAALRRALLYKQWPAICSAVWEDLCRSALPTLKHGLPTSALFLPAKRYWQGNAPEWDLVSLSMDKSAAILGEAKWKQKPCDAAFIQHAARHLRARTPPPSLPTDHLYYLLFVPERPRGSPRVVDGVSIIDAKAVLKALLEPQSSVTRTGHQAVGKKQ
jgi:AAA+ ATPase superfamily predicted ATPase